VPRRIIEDSGFINAESCVTRNGHAKTWHIGGVGLVCLDAIFAGGEWTPRDYRLVRSKSNGTHPSDHFGIAADMEL
jgi:hypothetical protein